MVRGPRRAPAYKRIDCQNTIDLTLQRNSTSMPESKLTKSERQAAAREKARQQREEMRRKQKRRRILIQSSVLVGIIAVAAIVTIVVMNAVRPSSASTAGPANMISDGIVIGAGLTAERTDAIEAGGSATDAAAGTENRLIIYLDYQCPNCGDFEATNGAQIEEWVSSGDVTLEIRPLSFLDSASQNNYSSRAANAAACVANYEPDSFFTFNTAMFNNQPDEGTAGPTNSEIYALITGVTGTENSDLESCVMNETYSGWVEDATDRGIGDPNEFGLSVSGTPAVFFNDTAVSGSITTDASVLASVVNAAIG